MGKRFCQYLRSSRPVYMFWEWSGEKVFVAVHVVPALFTCFGNGLETRFCRYLRSSSLVHMFWEWSVEEVLLLFM